MSPHSRKVAALLFDAHDHFSALNCGLGTRTVLGQVLVKAAWLPSIYRYRDVSISVRIIHTYKTTIFLKYSILIAFSAHITTSKMIRDSKAVIVQCVEKLVD